jgi:hypothetical protein
MLLKYAQMTKRYTWLYFKFAPAAQFLPATAGSYSQEHVWHLSLKQTKILLILRSKENKLLS